MDAPSSLTMKTRTPCGLGTRFMKSSVSRPAVPLPMAMTSIPGITLILAKLFAEQELDTPATRRLLDNVGNAPTADIAKGIVCNSFLSGDGNGVIRI